MIKTEELVLNADSKGLIETYYQLAPGANGVLGRSARTDPKVALEVVRKDPVVRGAIIKIVDKVCESGWRIQPIDGNQKSAKPAAEKKLREVRFDPLLRKVVFNLVMYNNAFAEVRKKKSELTNINLLESQFMKIDADDHGNILGYYQEVGRVDGQPYPSWTPEQVIHFKLDDYTTNVWSELNVEALYDTVVIKDAIRVWLKWLYETNQFRPIISVEESDNQKVLEFISFLKAAESRIGQPVVVRGKATIGPMQPVDIVEWAMKVLAWCDEQILKLLQIPHIAVGTSDNGGRADGAEQREYLNTRVFNIHRVLEDTITYDLFPKIGFDRLEFVFGIMDETVRTRVFENVQMMRNSMFTEEAMVEYMESQGLVFQTKKVLMSAEEMAKAQTAGQPVKTGSEGMTGKKSADAAQSRQRQNSQDVSKANRQA